MQLKRYRFNLQKAVNTIGSAASQSGGQILQKINQIKQLLSGGSVTISGKQVTVKDHPLARLYCINLLAKKLVVSLKQLCLILKCTIIYPLEVNLIHFSPTNCINLLFSYLNIESQ